MPSLYPRKRIFDPEISLNTKLTNKWPITDHYFVTYELLVNLFNDNQKSTDFKAKIDTGANISLFPLRFAMDLLEENSYIEHDLYGVVRDPQCRVQVKITKMNVLLTDELGNEISFYNCLIAFSDLANIPSLIGMKDLLDKSNLLQRKDDKVELRFDF